VSCSRCQFLEESSRGIVGLQQFLDPLTHEGITRAHLVEEGGALANRQAADGVKNGRLAARRSIHGLRYIPSLNPCRQSSFQRASSFARHSLVRNFPSGWGIYFSKNSPPIVSEISHWWVMGELIHPQKRRRIMKSLTDSAMNTVIERNGAFPHQASFCDSPSNLTAPRVRILADGGNATAPNGPVRSEQPKPRSEGARFALAVLLVIGAATLWGWALMQLCGLFLQATSVLIRNHVPLS
jgi:hypothetical protein